MEHTFEPKILAFCCRWCSYAAADLAGSMRLQYPTSIRIIMVPCTGRMDILHILKAVEGGADGILVSGCLPGDCHYISGNEKAAKRIAYTKKLFEEIGIEPERVEIYFNSSGMGPQFANMCRAFTEKVKEIGPLLNLS